MDVFVLCLRACAEQDAGDDDDDSDDGAQGGAAAKRGRLDEDVITSPVAILSIDCSADNSLIISGCADSTAKVFSVSAGRVSFLGLVSFHFTKKKKKKKVTGFFLCIF